MLALVFGLFSGANEPSNKDDNFGKTTAEHGAEKENGEVNKWEVMAINYRQVRNCATG